MTVRLKGGKGRAADPVGGGVGQDDAALLFHLKEAVVHLVPLGVRDHGLGQGVIGVGRFVQPVDQLLHFLMILHWAPLAFDFDDRGDGQGKLFHPVGGK